jgi:hypothetical protein
MKHPVSRLVILLNASILYIFCMPSLCAQQVQRIYVDRRTTGASLVSHGETGDKYIMLSRLGVYPVADSWLLGNVVEETSAGVPAYQAHEAVMCENGDIALLQYGFGGGRMFRIDKSGAIRTIPTRPQFMLEDLGVQTFKWPNSDGLFCLILIDTVWVSANAGERWYQVNNGSYEGGRISIHHSQPFRFAVIGTKQGSGFWHVARGYQDTAGFAVTPIPQSHNLASISSHLAFGEDSLVVWIKPARNAGVDSICYGTVGDSTSARCTAGMEVPGFDTLSSIRTLQIFGKKGGLVIALAADGKYYKYSNGKWKYSATLPQPQSVPPASQAYAQAGGYVSYLAKNLSRDSLIIVSLDLTDTVQSSVHKFPLTRYSDLPTLMAPYNGSTGILSYNQGVTSFIVDANLNVISVNSMVPENEELKMLPIICGFAQDSSRVLVASWDDYLVEPQGSSVGHVKSLFSRGVTYAPIEPVSYRNSTTGLRTPYVGKDEVIFPGVRTNRFDRNGHLLEVLDSQPSTAATRLQDGRIAIANSMVIRFWSNGSILDSLDLRALLCDSDSLLSGYISSIQTIGDSLVIALVNGLRIEDANTLEVHPLACGGVIASTNIGKTWTMSNTPFNEPYFIGMVSASDGSISASYTTLIKDTLEPAPDIGQRDEALTHRMVDRVVVRSTDDGVTWTDVYRTPSSRGFRQLGGNGIRLRDGRLLLITTDDILESTDDGLTWDFHVSGIQESVNPISLFTDDAGSVIYYCTDKGLYKSETITSVHDEQVLSRAVRTACTWTDHQNIWASTERRCISITNLMGEVVNYNATIAPLPGLYLAEIESHNTRSRTPIIVLGD